MFKNIPAQAKEGKLIFNSGKESVTLKTGYRMKLVENVKYYLTTKEDTVFLLTISHNFTKPSHDR